MPKSSQSLVATLVRSVFEQPDATQVLEQHARVVDQLADRFPAAAELLIDAGPDLLAFAAFPKEHWEQIWSNNTQERLNKDLRRRTEGLSRYDPASPDGEQESFRVARSVPSRKVGN